MPAAASASAASSPPTATPPRDRRPGRHDPRRPPEVSDVQLAGRALPERLHRHVRPRPPAARRRPGRPWSSRPPELQYPDRLNAAVELHRRAVAEHGAGPAGAAHARRHGRGPTASCCGAPTRSPRCSPRTSDWSPATACCCAHPTTRGPWPPGSASSRPAASSSRRWRRCAPASSARSSSRPSPSIALVDHRFVDDVDASATRRRLTSSSCRTAADGAGRPAPRAAPAKSGEFTAVDTAADDVALFGPTSGTTGVPKITMHFHRDILSIDNTFGRHILQLTADDVVAVHGAARVHLRARHAGGLPAARRRVRAAHRAGRRRRSSPSCVAEHGVTVLATAPTAYRAILKAGQVDQLARAAHRGQRRRAHPAGGLGARSATELGLAIVDGIGATEMLHIFISAAGDDIRPGRHRASRCPATAPRSSTPTASRVGARRRGPARRHRAGRLPLPRRRPAARLRRRRLERHRRHLLQRRGRLLLLPGPHRQHDRLLRLQHRRPRGRGRHRRSTPTSWRPPSSAEPDPERGSVVCAFVVLREGVVGDAAKAQGDPGLRQGDDGAVQVPPRGPLRRRSCHATPAASCSTSSSAT